LEKKALDKLANLETLTQGDSAAEFDRKRSIIEAALAKARERREASKGSSAG
jgi:electron transport complex protein RnfB